MLGDSDGILFYGSPVLLSFVEAVEVATNHACIWMLFPKHLLPDRRRSSRSAALFEGFKKSRHALHLNQSPIPDDEREWCRSLSWSDKAPLSAAACTKNNLFCDSVTG